MSNGDFTYQRPDEKAYFKTLIKYLDIEGEKEIIDLLKDAKCTIQDSNSFSEKRWNAYYTTIYFYIPIDKLHKNKEKIGLYKQKLIYICDYIMPKEVGFDVRHVEFSPSITEDEEPKTLEEDLEYIIRNLPRKIIHQILPEDIKQKGKDMTEVYLYLYCVENSLRLFIEKVAKDKWGDSYFKYLQLNKNMQKKIDSRKQQENKNKWLRLRGDSEIFYLDFKDLGTVIQNNWDMFSSYFPDQSWIFTKIKELAECRNLVAHNSFIEAHEKDVIKVNYISILRQLNETLRDQTKKE